MTVALVKQTDTHWVLKGTLDVDTLNQVIKKGCQLIQALPTGGSAQIDLSGVTHADSSSVALLIEWMAYAKQSDKTVSYTHIPQKMQDIIAVSNLGGIF